MRELGELYRIYKGDECDERALGYVLYVIEKEGKYRDHMGYLLYAVQQHINGQALYSSNSTTIGYMDNTYMEYFYPKFLAHKDPETLCYEEIYNIIANRKKHTEPYSEQFLW